MNLRMGKPMREMCIRDRYVDNANEEIDALHRIDPAKTAVVDKKFSAEVKSAAETDTLGTICLLYTSRCV